LENIYCDIKKRKNRNNNLFPGWLENTDGLCVHYINSSQMSVYLLHYTNAITYKTQLKKLYGLLPLFLDLYKEATHIFFLHLKAVLEIHHHL
jgi:hypothetical protein